MKSTSMKGPMLLVFFIAANPGSSFVLPTANDKNGIRSSLHRRATRVFGSDIKKPVTVLGPPEDTKPDYQNIHGPFGKVLDRILLTMFRASMADKVGADSKLPKVRDVEFGPKSAKSKENTLINLDV